MGVVLSNGTLLSKHLVQ